MNHSKTLRNIEDVSIDLELRLDKIDADIETNKVNIEINRQKLIESEKCKNSMLIIEID